MKKSLVGMLALLAGAYAAHAQGTVSLANYGVLSTYINVSFKPTVGSAVLLGGSATGPAPTLLNYAAETGNGNDWTVQLYGAVGSGLAAGSLSPLAGATSTFANGSTDPQAGTWFSKAVANVGPAGTLAGTVATVQLYAWYNDGGTITSYATALADGVPTGSSITENVSLGGPNATGPDTTPPGLPTPQNLSFNVTATPEPSTIALGVIGASAFLMRLRRKN
jgi:hypothetical protein